MSDAATQSAADATLSVLLYSSDATVREQVRLAVGRRPAAGLPVIQWTECATGPAVLSHLDAGGVDLVILDGEAQPEGGLGLCRQLKNEIFTCPPILVLTGRAQDSWLATWSLADHALCRPLDPAAIASTVAEMARGLEVSAQA